MLDLCLRLQIYQVVSLCVRTFWERVRGLGGCSKVYIYIYIYIKSPSPRLLPCLWLLSSWKKDILTDFIITIYPKLHRAGRLPVLHDVRITFLTINLSY